MSGQKGCMDANVAQHHAFSEGVDAFKVYIYRCAKDRSLYDGRKMVDLLDLFGSILVQHLTDEIPTIIALGRFGDERMAELEAIFGQEGERNMVRPHQKRRTPAGGADVLPETTGPRRRASVVLCQPRHHIRGRPVDVVAARADRC